jgi:hypothetical protein
LLAAALARSSGPSVRGGFVSNQQVLTQLHPEHLQRQQPSSLAAQDCCSPARAPWCTGGRPLASTVNRGGLCVHDGAGQGSSAAGQRTQRRPADRVPSAVAASPDRHAAPLRRCAVCTEQAGGCVGCTPPPHTPATAAAAAKHARTPVRALAPKRAICRWLTVRCLCAAAPAPAAHRLSITTA